MAYGGGETPETHQRSFITKLLFGKKIDDREQQTKYQLLDAEKLERERALQDKKLLVENEREHTLRVKTETMLCEANSRFQSADCEVTRLKSMTDTLTADLHAKTESYTQLQIKVNDLEIRKNMEMKRLKDEIQALQRASKQQRFESEKQIMAEKDKSKNETVQQEMKAGKLQTQVNSLKGQLEELENQKTLIEKEVQSTKQDHLAQVHEVKNLQSQLADAQADNNLLTSRLQREQDKREETESTHKSALEEQIQKVKTNALREKSDLQERNDLFVKEISSLETKLADSEKRTKKEQDRAKLQHTQIQRLQEELQENKNARDLLKSQLQSNEATAGRTIAEKSDLEMQIRALRSENDEYKTEIKRVTQTIQQQERELKAAEQCSLETEERIHGLQATVKRLQKDLAIQTKNNEAFGDDNTKLQDKIKQIETRAQNTSAEQKASIKKADELREQVKTLSETVQKKEQAATSLSQQLAHAQSTIQEKSSQISGCAVEISKLKAEAAKLKDQLDRNQKQNGELQRQLQDTEKLQKIKYETLTKQNAELKENLEAEKKKFEHLKYEKLSEEQKYKILAIKHDGQQSELEHKERQVQDLQKKLIAMESAENDTRANATPDNLLNAMYRAYQSSKRDDGIDIDEVD